MSDWEKLINEFIEVAKAYFSDSPEKGMLFLKTFYKLLNNGG